MKAKNLIAGGPKQGIERNAAPRRSVLPQLRFFFLRCRQSQHGQAHRAWLGHGCAWTSAGWGLDPMVSKVPSNQNNSVNLWIPILAGWALSGASLSQAFFHWLQRRLVFQASKHKYPLVSALKKYLSAYSPVCRGKYFQSSDYLYLFISFHSVPQPQIANFQPLHDQCNYMHLY